ncbi:MAG: hypothetical protein EXR81_03835 [Gammaproteobacteria bacterium]|nr:hypothetical protein [Gammaproteobacteria bacterium]
MGNIRTSFKGVTEQDKAKFKKSSCLLTISVGQEYHEGEKFAATVELIRSSFQSCTLVVCDTLQHYTMALNTGLSLDLLYQLAEKEGDLWLERNKEYIKRLMPIRISRWNEWLNHKLFNKQKNQLSTLIDEDPSYKNTFDMAITKYLDKYSRCFVNQANIDLDEVSQLCFEYIIEECVVFSLWTDLGCEYEIYPNPHNEAIQGTRARFIFEKNLDLLHPLRLKFHNTERLILPQKFHLLENLNKQDSQQMAS